MKNRENLVKSLYFPVISRVAQSRFYPTVWMSCFKVCYVFKFFDYFNKCFDVVREIRLWAYRIFGALDSHVMSTWAARMHRRAATFSNVVTSCGHPSGPYPRRLEKVKFGVPLEEVCKNDIPGPLLVSVFMQVKVVGIPGTRCTLTVYWNRTAQYKH